MTTNGNGNGSGPVDTALMISSSSRDPKTVTERLQNARQHAHLVSPMTQCPELPEGVEIAFTSVLVDTSKDAGEIYPVGGNKYGLSKVILDQISVALGVTFENGARNDDRSNPHYCSRTETGWLKLFDGQMVRKNGTSTIDLSDGSALCEEVYELKREKFIEKAIKNNGGKDLSDDQYNRVVAEANKAATREIRRKRIKIEELTESGARLRAIRTMGVKSTYTLAELEKPFVIVKAFFTGRTKNRALEPVLAGKVADNFFSSREVIFGRDRQDPLTVPQQYHERQALPPAPADYYTEPAGSFIDVDDDEDAAVERAAVLEPEESAHSLDNVPPEPGGAQAPPPPVDVFELTFGKHAGKMINDAAVDAGYLTWLLKAYDQWIADPQKAQHATKNKAQRTMVEAELARRETQRTASKSTLW